MKLVALFLVGFGDDEAYTLVIARQLSLSYFDHPPLHQWILHAFVALVGEGRIARLPFWAMIVATNAPLYGLTRRMFGRDAALWALLAFNATPYFLLWPDGFILPDAALLPLLATAVWAIVEATSTPEPSPRRVWGCWLAAGLALGLAGLDKYMAAFVPLGLAGYFLASARHRRWFGRPEPYVGAALALAVFSPAVIWNADNGFVSFAFQGGRAAAGRIDAVAAAKTSLESGLEQAASVSPWIFIAALIALARAARAPAASGERLMLWLSAPTLIFFAVLPFFGQRAIPHWFNSGWLFAYPLLGAWLAGLSPRWAKGFAVASCGLTALCVALYVPLTIWGLPSWTPAGVRDPTAGAYDWPSVAASRAWKAGGKAPDFVVVDHWRAGGRVGVALGPEVPVCAFTPDPRGFAFACDLRDFVGRNALIVIPAERAAEATPALAAYFARVDAAEVFAAGRPFDLAERKLALVRAYDLLKPYPLPYGPGRGKLTRGR